LEFKSPFSTNMAISETKGQRKGKGSRGSFNLLCQLLQPGKTNITPRHNLKNKHVSLAKNT